MAAKPELIYEDLQVGKEFEPYPMTVSQEFVTDFLKAIDEEDSIYGNMNRAKEWGFARPIAPQSLAAIYARASYLKDYSMPGGGILSKQEFHFYCPIFIEDELVCKAKVVDRFLKKERKYVVIEISTYNQDGLQVSLVRIEAIWPK